MNDTVNNNTKESFEYARYWHGYMIFLRPLLLILNITQIRKLLLIMLAILGITLLIIIAKKINIPTAIIFLLGMFIADYFYVGISLQGAPVFIILIIASIIVMSEKFKKYTDIIFLIIGGLTSFFDFLTVPIMTLAIPLLLYILLLQRQSEITYKKIYIEIVKLIVLWGIGYIGIFLSKWIIIDLIYNKNVIISALQQLLYRTNLGYGVQYTFMDVLSIVMSVIKYPFIISIIATIGMLIYNIIKNRFELKFNFKTIIPYILVLCIIIMWYIILANHSYLHYIFTYRNCFGIVICILLIVYNILEINKK